MKRKVRITKMPKAAKGGSNRTFGDQAPPQDLTSTGLPVSYQGGSDPKIKVKRTLQPTSKENATLEAELGETVITNLQGEGIPEFYKIGGKPHSRGGTPLNLPANSFIFSKDKSLKIKDPEIQELFGKPINKKGYTPAEMSMSYDLNSYREILLDPSSDKKQIETAELMIKNYNLKLGSLALVQESIKGFEDGIPAVSMAYMEHMGIQPGDLLGTSEDPNSGLQEFRQGGQYMPKYNLAGATPMTSEEAQENINLNFDINARDVFSNKKDIAQTLVPGGLSLATMIGNYDDGTELEKRMNQMTSLEELATSVTGNTGFDTINPVGVNKPDEQTPVQFTGMDSGFAKMGGTQGKRKVRVALPKAKHGIPHVSQPAIQKPVKKYYDLPEDAKVHDPSKPGYDDSKVKQGHYIIDENGVPRKLTGKKIQEYDNKYRDESLGLSPQFQDAYGLLQSKIEGSPALKKALIEQYKEDLKTLTPGNNLTREDIVAMQNLDDKDIIDNFYDFQLRNYKVADKAGKLTGEDKKIWDRTAGKGQVSEFLKELGYTDDQINNTGATSAFQNTYAALEKLAQTGEFDKELEGLNIGQVGMADETGAGTGKNTISGVDGWYGNTTAGQIVLPLETENVYEDVAEVQQELEAPLLKAPSLKAPPAKAWLQDQRNVLGAFGDYASAEKQNPWQAPTLFNEAMPTFQDFRGTAARITSLGKGMGDSLAAFAGPQSYNSRMSDLSRKGVDGILKAQEAEQRGNVAVANQFEQFNVGQRNKYNNIKAGLATNLFDKQIAANQAFDNEKRALKWNLINQGNNLTTNKWKTDAMNQMYPQYAVNPGVGGQLYFDPSQATDVTASAQPTNPMDTAVALKSKYGDMSWSEAMKGAGMDVNEFPQGVDPRTAMQGYPGATVGPMSYPGVKTS
jgi:hypothetical protein